MEISWGEAVGWIRHVVDITIVSYLIYRVLLVFRGTRGSPMLAGLAILLFLYFLSRWLGLVTLAWILSYFLGSIIVIFVVLFQNELRRGLTKVGLQRMFRKGGAAMSDKIIEDITLVASRLSRDRIGSLIVIQREVGLEEFVEDAVAIDAIVNRKLLYAIFVKDSPLHDGAVLIEEGRIKAAGCVLPLSFTPDLDPNLGTRHRAALGITEQSDALAIVVSEETGSISLARDGRMTRNMDPSMLRDSLHRLLHTNPDEQSKDDEEDSDSQ